MSRWLAQLHAALRSLVGWRHAEDDLDEELRYHLERQIDDGVKAGLAPADARYAALRAMGAIEKSKEESRELRRGHVVSEFLGDLRYAGRAVRRAPGFAALVITIMALGIGANTAVFSVINAVLLKPLPYPDADRIVTLSTSSVTTGELNPLVTLANFRDWRAQSASFEAMATYRGGDAPVTPGDTAEYARHANVDVQFFRVLGIDALIGRTFTEADALGSGHPVALISHAYWQTRYGGDPAVLQRTIRVGSGVRPIVGVLPPGFHFPSRADVWTPQPEGSRAPSRTSHSFLAIARLKPQVSLQSAQTELNTIAGRLAGQYPDSNTGRGVVARPLQDVLVGDVGLLLYLLWGVVGVVLLIACANTATLLLGKATARRREIVVRTALGASRSRIVRQLTTESLLLAILAGLLGILVAVAAGRVLVAIAPADVVRLADTGIDGGVLAFTLGVSVVTSLLFGILPALQASRVDLADAVKSGGSRSVVGGQMTRTRAVLVVAEIALAVVLVTGAGLLVKSLIALQRVDLGFQPDNVLVMKATGVRTRPENNAFFSSVVPRLAALPGVVAAGATSVPPGDLSNLGDGSYFVDQFPDQRDRSLDPRALFTIVAPGAFAALGIPIKSGRDFNDGDMEERPLVAIVNEALVRKAFAGQDPIGRTLFCTFDRPKEGMTIVGVVGDVRQRDPALEPMPECYMPYRQHAYNNNTLMVVARTTGDPMALSGTARSVAAEIAPEVPVSFTTMDATVAKRVEDRRFRTSLFSVFAALAVCLAVAGVYGVMAYAVGQRSKELSLRLALGASRGMVRRQILAQTLLIAGIGIGVGLAVAAAATRLLTTMLFEVRPTDTLVFLGVAVLVGVVTLTAGYLPARRASSVDPAEMLKSE